MAEPQRDELSDIDKEMLECQALQACGDVEMARRLVAARYWVESRRPGADGHRVLIAPESEVPCSES